MIRKSMWGLLAVSVLVVLLAASSSMALTIGGVVRQPLNLSLEDLAKLESVSARLNEVTSDNRFGGAFTYRGVPLRTLLGLASIEKEESGFPKPVDLAVVVRNREGKTAVLSWGEIFYRNPSEIVVAVSTVPVMPFHKNCGDCHGAEVYEPAMNRLKRTVGLPKLIVANDFFTDRSLEDIVHIDVIDMKQKTDKKQMKTLFSPKFTIADVKGKSVEIGDLAGYARTGVSVKNVGEGRGYHGWRRFEGVPLREVLAKKGVMPDSDTAILASAADGYRVLISYGELFLAPGGEKILVADGVGGKPLKEGKFTLVLPDDLFADRMVKALSRIEIVSLKERGKVYVIGVGCADTSLVTLEAISYMGKADAFIAAGDIAKRFSKYLGGKPVLFDPMKSVSHLFKKENSDLPEAKAKEKLEMQRAGNKKQIMDALNSGRNVALLEYGDPTIYPPWQNWLDEEVRSRVEIVPGISAFNASNAMIGGNLACKGGSLIITMPRALSNNEEMLKAVAADGDTMAVFMGVRELKTMAPLLLKYYPPSTPIRIVYKAGYSNGKKLVKSTLGEAIETAGQEKEQHLAMIYMGPCLK